MLKIICKADLIWPNISRYKYMKGTLFIHNHCSFTYHNECFYEKGVSVVRLNKTTCFLRRPSIRYMVNSAHDAAFPVTSPGILATLMPHLVAALISTP